MDFRFDEEQEELRATAQAFLDEHAGSESVRKAMETDLGFDPALWERIGSELGWAAVHIPEAYGGLDFGAVELAALMEIMGGALLCAPYFSSVCLGANALLVAGSEAQKEEHLPGVAEGRARPPHPISGAPGGQQAGPRRGAPAPRSPARASVAATTRRRSRPRCGATATSASSTAFTRSWWTDTRPTG